MILPRALKFRTTLLLAFVVSTPYLLAQEPIPNYMVSVPKKEIVHEYNIISSMPREKQYAIFTAAMISLTENPDSARNILNKMQDPYVRPRDLFPPADVSNAKTNKIGGDIPVAFASMADVSNPLPPSQDALDNFWRGYDTGTKHTNLYNYHPNQSHIEKQIPIVYSNLMEAASSSNSIDMCAYAYGYHFGLEDLPLTFKPTIPCLDWYHYVKSNNIKILPNK